MRALQAMLASEGSGYCGGNVCYAGCSKNKLAEWWQVML